MDFSTAYRQLQPSERTYVDGFVTALEGIAVRDGVRLEVALHKPDLKDIPDREKSMLQRPLVRAAIVERVKELSEALELSQYRTMKEMRAIAYSSIGHYMEVGQDGIPWFDLTKCTPEQLSAIKSVKIEESATGRRKFEFTLHDKMGALMAVAKYQGLLEPSNDAMLTGKTGSEQTSLPANVTDEQAANAYQRLVAG